MLRYNLKFTVHYKKFKKMTTGSFIDFFNDIVLMMNDNLVIAGRKIVPAASTLRFSLWLTFFQLSITLSNLRGIL